MKLIGCKYMCNVSVSQIFVQLFFPEWPELLVSCPLGKCRFTILANVKVCEVVAALHGMAGCLFLKLKPIAWGGIKISKEPKFCRCKLLFHSCFIIIITPLITITAMANFLNKALLTLLKNVLPIQLPADAPIPNTNP